MRLNRDTIVAIVLLVICGVFWQQSLEIRDPGYPGQLSPAAWPRAVLGALSLLCLIYLLQSLRQGPDAPSEDGPSGGGAGGAVMGFITHWRNVLWCFSLFLAYLLVMPWLGMLVAGTLFVFLLLCALGGWSARLMALHAAIALCTMGGMWMLFTYGLNVFLPAGSLIGRY